MKSLIKGLALNYSVKVFATGFIVLVLLSLPLFWFRSACETSLAIRMPDDARDVSIRPSGLVPPEFENYPNVVSHSEVSAGIGSELPLSLGIVDYFIARFPKGGRSNVYQYNKDRQWWMYFDEKTGQIICRSFYREIMPDGTVSVTKVVPRYAGTEGVSETPNEALGRFIDPIINRVSSRVLILYDKKLRCFFRIDFGEKTVVKGPQLGDDDPHKPVQIGVLGKNHSLLYLHWVPPMKKASHEEAEERGYRRRTDDDYISIPIVNRYYPHRKYHPLLVLDETGRIDLLDKQTLTFTGTAGRLPAPESLFPSTKAVTPKGLLAYEVLPLAFETDRKYLGMFAASLSRDGTALALAVFDEKGKVIKTEYSRLPKYEGRYPTYVESSKAVFFGAPWSPTLTIGKYLAENLHPPILSVASYFTASAFEAASGHRALFFLPNSFIAMKGRDYHGNFAERFMSALWLILPSIILAILLAWRVGKNAAVIGLSENTRHYWIIGTLAFGLAAYITYRLTRSKITLVTCQNCGKMRRPDMAKCHRCGSKWHVPELTPPAWRVLDGGE